MNRILFILCAVTFPWSFSYGGEIGIKVIKTHKVVDGDTLWGISAGYYGAGEKWGKIYNANLDQIKNPDLILPAMELQIPEIKEEIKPVLNSASAPEPAVAEVLPVSSESAAAEIKKEVPPPAPAAVMPAVQQIKAEPAAEEKKSKPEYEKVDPYELSEKMPAGQLTSSIFSQTIKAAPDFFCGQIISKEAEDEFEKQGLISEGDTVKVKLNGENFEPGETLAVYQKGFSEGGKITAQLSGLLEITEIKGKKGKCRVVKVSKPLEAGMLLRKIKK